MTLRGGFFCSSLTRGRVCGRGAAEHKNKNVVTETGVELATNRFIVNRLNQLDQGGN